MSEHSQTADRRRTDDREEGGRAQTLLLMIAMAIAIFVLLMVAATRPDLVFVVAVTMVTMILVYAGSMAKARLRGYLVGPMIEGLYMLGPTLAIFVILALRPEQIPASIGELALPVLLLGSVIAANPMAEARSVRLPVVIRSLGLVFAGVLLWVLMGMMGERAWAEALLLGLSASGAIGLLALFRGHSNVMVSDIGAAVDRTSSMVLATALMTGLSVYAICLRPELVRSSGALITAIEWMAVALTILTLAILVKRRLASVNPVGQELRMEAILSEPALAQSEMSVATDAVKAFIEQGSKERVVVLLVSALRNNGLSDAEVADLIVELVRYREEEVALAWAWTYGNIKAQRRKDRVLLLSRVLKRASLKVGKGASRLATGQA